MAPDISAHDAPAGDVAGAIMRIDSFLRRIYAGLDGTTPGDDMLDASDVVTSEEQFQALLDGYCTVIFMLIACWRNTLNEDGGNEGDTYVLENVIPEMVTGLRHMTRNVAPSVIPTMAGMLTAAALGLSPNGWREQFGEWQREELPALEATAAGVADRVNRMHDDRDAALRIIVTALGQAE